MSFQSRARDTVPEIAQRFSAYFRARPEEGKTARRSRGERAEPLLSEALRQIVVKAQPERVRGQSGRPIGKATVDTIYRHGTPTSCRLTLDRSKIARVQPAFAGDGAFFPGRETLDLPDRQPGIRKGQ